MPEGAATPGPAQPESAGRDGAAGEDGTTDDGGPAAEAPDGALIVRTGSLELEVADLDAALAQARAVIATAGGYVSASEELDDGERRSAVITYRIPIDRWDAALADLRELAARVVRESTQAEEVTAQVVDLVARIANLRSSETALQGIMERAGTIEDVLSVQTRLNDVREEIERLVAQQQALEERAALATLSVSWSVPLVAVTEASQGWDLGAEIDHAAAQTVQAAQGLASVLVWLLVVGVPVLGPMILLAFVALKLAGRWNAARPETPNPPRWGPGVGGSGTT